ncbi:MAG: hypothetical protein COX41_07205 [Candidatus Omnitrophica bacterium CG23_combo_of_CG06-09_8_20_14_all_41_10]|uniref:Uncharacterized protein n=1 Tax=Candidatus Sherwoodlollariibacterium unditelluris TaxID=1974757 RepID=A0A2G9YHC4_9BACT|nr:MAG: hypothetical protein COX41_07205 [Candidatus Omnitrophica bacterium CG23_combo_of_CG06-09_8_20_14_all_41_10]
MKRRVILVLSFFIQAAIVFEAGAADTTIKGTGATSATAGLEVTNSSDTSLLYVRNDGNVSIGTTSPTAKLHIGGDNAKQLSIDKSSVAVTAPGAGVGMLREEAQKLGKSGGFDPTNAGGKNRCF